MIIPMVIAVVIFLSSRQRLAACINFYRTFFADAKKHTLPIIIELSVFVNPYFSVSGDLLYEYEISQECYIMFTWILAEKSEKGLTSR
jgi:hypothetical protein